MSLRILIVDDTRFLRMMLTDILTNSGYEVVGQAENGLIGIEKFKELRPDIVMMDISMPEMDGIQALKEIKKIDADAVVLICSAMSQRELISRALEAGANNYVTKPFDPESINTLIENVIPLIERKKMAGSEDKEDPDELMESLGQGPVLNQQELEHLSQLLSRGSWDNDTPAETSPDLDLRSEREAELESRLELDAESETKLGLDSELISEPNPELELETELELELELESDLGSVLELEPNSESNSDLESASNLGQKHGYLTEENYYELDQPEELLSEDEPDHEESTDQFGAILRAFAEAGAAEEVEEDEDSKEEDEYMSFFEKVHADFELGSEMELGSGTEEAAAAMTSDEEATGEVDEALVEETAKEGDEEAVEQLEEGIGDMLMTVNENANINREEEEEEKMIQTENTPASDFKKSNVKNFVSSMMCNWTEVSENQEVNHLVIFNEHDKTIQIDVMALNDQKQSLKLTLDSFSYLVSWLKEKGIPVDPQ
nr:response regulator [Paenibacillus ihumii]